MQYNSQRKEEKMHARKVFYRLDELDELKKAAGIHAGKPPPFRGEKDEAKQAAALARVAGASWPPFVKGKRRENGPLGKEREREWRRVHGV